MLQNTPQSDVYIQKIRGSHHINRKTNEDQWLVGDLACHSKLKKKKT